MTDPDEIKARVSAELLGVLVLNYGKGDRTIRLYVLFPRTFADFNCGRATHIECDNWKEVNEKLKTLR